MTTRRFFVLLVAALVAILGAMYVSSKRHLPRDERGADFAPELTTMVARLDRISLRKDGTAPSVTLNKQGDIWRVAERANYPAAVGKLRALILAVTDAKIIEEKTSTPANYPLIGVDDPAEPNSEATEILFGAGPRHFGLLIGKSRGNESYVRKSNEAKSYLVSPAVTVDAAPAHWIDPALLDLKLAEISRIQVAPAGGSAYAISRSGNNFTLEAVPPGRKAAEPSVITPSPTTFGALEADEVSAASDIDFAKASTAVITLTDGRAYGLAGVIVGDKHWLKVSSDKDGALMAKAAGRAFEVPGYRFDAMFRPLEALLIPRSARAAKHPPAPKS